jgi:hypothetical protein
LYARPFGYGFQVDETVAIAETWLVPVKQVSARDLVRHLEDHAMTDQVVIPGT